MSVSSSKRAADLITALLLFYGAVWIYEVSNWLALSAVGFNTHLVVQGLLPIGVIATSIAGTPWLAKILQVTLSEVAIILIGKGLWKYDIPLAKLSILSLVGCFMGSIIWEGLGETSPFAYLSRTALFLTVVLGLPALFAVVNRNSTW